MPCLTAIDNLVKVVLTATVTTSNLGAIGANVGDKMTLSIVADSAWIHREIVGQGVLQDGIGPFGVCEEHFKLSFSSGMHAFLTPPAHAAASGPIDKDAVSTGSLGLPLDAPPFWFSLVKARPVLDGAFFSSMADKASAGLPLTIHGASLGAVYKGIFDLAFKRGAIPDVHLSKAFGNYGKDVLNSGNIALTRDWDGNTVLMASFESLTIGPA
jgi:hypothetical protein